MIVEVLYFTGCPHAANVLVLVRGCLARLGLEVAVVEQDGDYPSPSVRINGRDVMGEPRLAGRACRLDLPTTDRVMDALDAAARGEPA